MLLTRSVMTSSARDCWITTCDGWAAMFLFLSFSRRISVVFFDINKALADVDDLRLLELFEALDS
ncbi:hypothetical protein [Rhizobium ruizarguesonis]|uniref:hypothetical protein n=1 Tax=Rhizobium ruizarguesonis TaxID=2081791 RepID=UPI0013EE6521|nr:hypothetical protein [Rhizobium ruizarguesonis]